MRKLWTLETGRGFWQTEVCFVDAPLIKPSSPISYVVHNISGVLSPTGEHNFFGIFYAWLSRTGYLHRKFGLYNCDVKSAEMHQLKLLMVTHWIQPVQNGFSVFQRQGETEQLFFTLFTTALIRKVFYFGMIFIGLTFLPYLWPAI